MHSITRALPSVKPACLQAEVIAAVEPVIIPQ